MVRRQPHASAAKRESAPTGSPIRLVASRTGIPEETLRAWERRYGFPAPLRRAGGSRVYSETDIAKLHVLARAVAAGFRPGDVVQLSVAALEELLDSAARDTRAQPPPALPESSADCIATLLEALRRDDAAVVRATLHELAVRLGPRRFVTECAHPLLVGVGAEWAEGALDVRHEHLASAYLQTELRAILASVEEDADAPVVLLTTLPEEPHALPLDLVAVYLTSLGVAPRLLGPGTPAAQITAAAIALRVAAVGISTSVAAPPRPTQLELHALRSSLPATIPLWVGGSGARLLAPPLLQVTVLDSWLHIDDAVRALR